MKNAQMIPSQTNTNTVPMYIAFELSNSKWKLMFSDGFKRRQKTIAAGNLIGFEKEVVSARERFKLPEGITIYSCYEAGRDGFWIHRYLEKQGICNFVVDSSSIEVNRRQVNGHADSVYQRRAEAVERGACAQRRAGGPETDPTRGGSFKKGAHGAQQPDPIAIGASWY